MDTNETPPPTLIEYNPLEDPRIRCVLFLGRTQPEAEFTQLRMAIARVPPGAPPLAVVVRLYCSYLADYHGMPDLLVLLDTVVTPQAVMQRFVAISEDAAPPDLTAWPPVIFLLQPALVFNPRALGPGSSLHHHSEEASEQSAAARDLGATLAALRGVNHPGEG